MRTAESAGSVAVGGAIPERPRFFGRRAWYRRRVRSLEVQAALDDLTGLRNHRALWRELSSRATSCSAAAPLTVVMLDFDLFGDVNARHGHAVGDAVLERGAAVLRDAVGSSRSAFRYGGEEFVLLVAGDETAGCDLAERVRVDIARQVDGLPASTVSCGVAEFVSPVEPWAALDRVDAALREAKRTGRNRIAVAGRTDRTSSAYLVGEREHETARRAALALAVATLEVRDRNTAEHADDVLTLCESIGRELGFEGRELEHLMAGAQLHDVGKVAVASEILNKPGPLDDDEWAVIREHTVIGERILRSVPEMAEVATIVRHSHEHWDGSGYPDGLTGESIPLASRIVLCADAFHAIRSDRPYRAGRSAAEALEELRACAGAQFDPAVVEALCRVAEHVRARRLAGMSAPRGKRLVVLLTTLALTGSAVAAVPELRDAVGSVFGATTAKPRLPASGEPERDLGPAALPDRPSVAPTRAGAHAKPEGSPPQARRRPDARAAARARSRTRTRTRTRTRLRTGSRRSSPPPSRVAGGRPARRTTAAATTRPPASEPARANTRVPAAKLAAPGVYCRGESRKPSKAEKRSDFSICVGAQAALRRGETDSPREACRGADGRRAKGAKGTALSRCVAAGERLQKDRRAR